MFDDDELVKEALPYISTILLSTWGGTVAYVQKVIDGNKFSWGDLFMDLIVSSFVGILTYFICTYARLEGPISAVLIAMSGHMGTRALLGLTKIRDSLFDRILGIKEDKN